jgi:uncharacterized PurR-regulated membrane protein YhhQ (DUF165 family)
MSVTRPEPMGVAICAGFLATVPAANWLIGNVGTVCIPQGPCLVPVGFGLMAPSGVLMIGLAMLLRDAVREVAGLRAAVALVLLGAAISAAFATPGLVLASLAAFALAELADTAVYEPLRRRSLPVAVMASGAVGALIDSALFLWLAFGSLQYMPGQVVGKLWASAAAALVLAALRRRV